MSAVPTSAKPHSFYIRPAPGWLDLTFEEVKSVLQNPFQKYKFEAQVSLLKSTVKVSRCDWRQGLELPYRLNTAHDVEWLMWESNCNSWSELESNLKKIPWSEIGIVSGGKVHINLELSQGFTQGTAKIREKLCQAAKVEHVSEGATIRLKAELRKERFRLLVSLAGAPLYQRGYKKNLTAIAPLTEHLAACCVKWTLSDLSPKHAINAVWIPFAGSGTLGFETVIALTGLGPGTFQRSFAMETFPAVSKATLKHFRKKLIAVSNQSQLPRFVFTEINPQAMMELKENVAHFPVKMDCRFEEEDVFETNQDFSQEKENILVLLNPPFGSRLAKSSSVKDLYARLGKMLNERLSAFQERVTGGCICPDELTWKALIRELGAKKHVTHHFTHGGEQMRLLRWHF